MRRDLALMFRDFSPPSGVLDSLRRGLRPGDLGRMESLHVPAYQFYDDHAIGVVITALARAGGFVAIAFMLTYLGSAVRARSTVSGAPDSLSPPPGGVADILANTRPCWSCRKSLKPSSGMAESRISTACGRR